MLDALLILAAAEGAEPSKAAFYISGIALAVWAVVLAGIGLSRAEFPGTATLARGVMALTTVLVVAALSTAVITS